jgi:GNAT superfamily N-acetyltransferase
LTVQRQTSESDGDYEIRLFESGDRQQYLALYSAVLSGGTERWFEWKYVDNPYVDHVPIVVAVADGRVVGAKSGMAFEIGREENRFSALQPADTMVHPDHRRQGIYSRMTEHMKDVYTDRGLGLFFNYPNDATLSGSLKHGWDHVDSVTTRYRIRDPAAFAGVEFGPLDGAIDAVGRVAADIVLGRRSSVRDVLGRRSSVDNASDLSVRRHRSVPVETVARLYRRRVPDRFHVVRDERYLRWRYDNPDWEYTAYTVQRDGDPVSGAVVGRGTSAGVEEASLTDLLPLGGPVETGDPDSDSSTDSSPADREATTALLDRILADYRDVEVITAADDVLPAGMLATFGFLPDTEPPLSWVSSPRNLVAYPVDEAIDPERLADPAEWLLGLSDRDTR